VTTKDRFEFSEDHARANESLASIAAGKGWCNVSPVVVDEDVPELKVNIFGLWINKGVTVATFVTTPPRAGVDQPSSLGLLHTRGKLGAARIKELLGSVPYIVQQDHSQRGLLLSVPTSVPASAVVEVMSTMTAELCDYELVGRWAMTLFRRN
jgi:hypothetical protein